MNTLITPLLQRLSRGESLSDFQQGILFAHYYALQQPTTIQEATETCGGPPSGPSTGPPTHPPRWSPTCTRTSDSFMLFPFPGFEPPEEIPLTGFMEPIEPTVLASETAEVVRFQFPSTVLDEMRPHAPTQSSEPSTPRIKGKFASRPYLAHLKEGETIEIRRKRSGSRSHNPVSQLTVRFLNGRFYGFHCAANNTVYRNLGVALKDILRYNGTRAAQYCYVQREETWVCLETLLTPNH